MSPLQRYLLKRLLFVPLGLFIVVTVSFALVNLTPGDPARLIAGGLAGEDEVQAIREQLGLNLPLPQRYSAYLGGLARGDLGTSYYTRRPVIAEVRERLPDTLELVLMALVVASLYGLAIGGLGAYFRGRVVDRAARLLISVSQSIPDFLMGLLLIYVVFFLLGWAPPPVGRLGLLDTPPPTVTDALILDAALAGQWDTLRSALHHAVLPVLALGFFYSAFFAKTARAVLGRAFDSDQVEFARACGLSERSVVGYAFRQARAPILTYGAILFGVLIGGAAIIETVFSWGGFGQWAIDIVLNLDIPAIQGFILVTGLITLATYVVLDVLVAFLDPRITYG